MACKCKDNKDFKSKLKEAISLEQRTGNKVVVYKVPNTDDKLSIGYLDTVKNISGVCCYYLTNGVEVLVKSTQKKKKTVKSDAL